MYTVLVKEGRETRNSLMKFLCNHGIMTKIYFDSVHLSKFYSKFGYKVGDLPITEDLSNRVLSLPLYATIKKSEIDGIINIIRKYFKKYAKK